MGCKGQATSAVFRSFVFQINFLGSFKLVAVKSLAPELGPMPPRCARRHRPELSGYRSNAMMADSFNLNNDDQIEARAY